MAIEVSVGAVLDGRYRIDRPLGGGGMGVVWAATQVLTRQPVALKFLRSDLAVTELVKKRFVREARTAAAVRHPNVVQILDVLEIDETPVIVMELLLGESLDARLARDRVLSLPDLARILLPAVSAVGTAHSLGIVHRDLKPDNIFLANEAGGVAKVKVLDFGIAKLTATEGDAAKTGGLTGTGSMLGTPFYMSPEQAFGEKDIDHRADVWSLGIIFYQCLTGQLPTRADNMGQILKVILTDGIRPLATVAPHLPADLTDLVGRMLSRDRTGRPKDLREVYNVLRRYADVDAKSFDGAIAPAILPSGPHVAGAASNPSNPLAASDPYGMTEAATPPPGSLGGHPQTPGALESGPISDTLDAGPPLDRRFFPVTLGQVLPPGSNTAEPYEIAPGSRSPGTTWRIALAAAVAIGGAGLGAWALTHKRAANPQPPVASASMTAPVSELPPPPSSAGATTVPAPTIAPPASAAPSATTSAIHKHPVVANPASPSAAAAKPRESRPDGGADQGVFVDKPPF